MPPKQKKNVERKKRLKKQRAYDGGHRNDWARGDPSYCHVGRQLLVRSRQASCPCSPVCLGETGKSIAEEERESEEGVGGMCVSACTK